MKRADARAYHVSSGYEKRGTATWDHPCEHDIASCRNSGICSNRMDKFRKISLTNSMIYLFSWARVSSQCERNLSYTSYISFENLRINTYLFSQYYILKVRCSTCSIKIIFFEPSEFPETWLPEDICISHCGRAIINPIFVQPTKLAKLFSTRRELVQLIKPNEGTSASSDRIFLVFSFFFFF